MRYKFVFEVNNPQRKEVCLSTSDSYHNRRSDDKSGIFMILLCNYFQKAGCFSLREINNVESSPDSISASYTRSFRDLQSEGKNRDHIKPLVMINNESSEFLTAFYALLSSLDTSEQDLLSCIYI